MTTAAAAPDRICAKIRATRGLPAAIARACGVSRFAIYQWKRVPPARVHEVALIIGLSPKQIRPDIFRKPNKPGKDHPKR